MRRRLFTFCSALSLLMCVAICVLWVRSYALSDQVVWRWQSVCSAQGHVVLSVVLLPDSDAHRPADFYVPKYTRETAHAPFDYLWILDLDLDSTDFGWEWGGFAWHQRREKRGNLYAVGIVPFWGLALATAVMPLGWAALRWRSRARSRRAIGMNRCSVCGYDLRATPSLCPECGSRPAKIKAVQFTSQCPRSRVWGWP